MVKVKVALSLSFAPITMSFFYRAVIAEAIPKKDSCFAHLVDYGRRVKCDLDQLFDWRDQLTNIQILFIVHDETLCFID